MGELPFGHHIKAEDFHYDLPLDRIAKYPLGERDSSKLLVYQSGTISQNTFANLDQYFNDRSLLIRNNTRVIQARLEFHKVTGARIEVFCLEPYEPSDYQINLSQSSKVVWKCLVGNARKWKRDTLLTTSKSNPTNISLCASCLDASTNGEAIIEFSWDPDTRSFAEILEIFGTTPIPPYLNREAEIDDRTRYQTVYAKSDGSVAAPTAGLHFTPLIAKKLIEKGIDQSEVTLHVGAGTFKPVTSENLSGHKMHAETTEVSRKTIQSMLQHLDNGITTVGTTTIRTIESLYWIALAAQESSFNPNQAIFLPQWTPYHRRADLTPRESLEVLISRMTEFDIDNLRFLTQIIIVPGYQFKYTSRLITNFHMPSSTLLLLVSAFTDGNWRQIYEYALNNEFRFLSYGDSSLLIRK